MQRNIKYILDSFGLGGVRTIDYELASSELEQRSSNFDLEPSAIAQSNKTSYLGTPVFGDITLRNDNASIELITVLATVGMSKNIVKTPMQGVNGTIKEYISDGDYDVDIQGVLVSNSDLRPDDKIKTLQGLCTVASSLEIESSFLQLFDIYNVVVESFRFLPQKGFWNMMPFELKCVSDHPIEILVASETIN